MATSATQDNSGKQSSSESLPKIPSTCTCRSQNLRQKQSAMKTTEQKTKHTETITKKCNVYKLELQLNIADDYNAVRQSPLRWKTSNFYSSSLESIKEEVDEEYEPQLFYDI